ncbi:MAG: glutathione S-transferase, partial [Rhodospirillaceae bacterium]|nr:glutathione S-transferase [Rhodospirillaceae bacterium]
MALEIIGFPRSNFVRTVRMVAEEKGVPYEHIAAMPHSDEVKA